MISNVVDQFNLVSLPSATFIRYNLFKMIALFFSLMYATAFAQGVDYHLGCISPDLRVKADIVSVKDRMVFTYTNAAGKENFPIYNGIVTNGNFSYLKKVRRALSELDGKIQMSWPIEACSIDDKNMFIVACRGNPRLDYPEDSELVAASFYTSIITEQTINFSYENLRFRFILNAHDGKFEISIPFPKDQCKKNGDKII